jgi:hypothetical protein
LSEKPITFPAYFYKAQTTVDGGWRIYLDLDASSGDVVAKLAQTQGIVLQVAVVPEEES